MASLLHAIGRWCAEHAWRAIAAWLAILVMLGALAATFGTPSTNQVTIPGAQFQKVMDDLHQDLPEVSGNIGTAVFTTESGKFTPAQERAVGKVIDSWKTKPHVTSTVNPFVMQRKFDEIEAQAKSKKPQLDEGYRKLAAGEKQVQKLRDLVRLSHRELAKAERNDPNGSQAQLLRVGVPSGERDLAKAERQLDSAREQLQQGQRKYDLATMSTTVRFVSLDGDTALAQLQFDTNAQTISPEDRAQIVDTAAQLEGTGVTLDFSQDLTQEMSVVGPGEVVGLATAGVVLLLMLGSLLAAGLPLLTALVGVGVGLAGAVAATAFFEMHAMTPALALMLGLAVGIDYALFIVHRHRVQLATGMDVRPSIALAVGTAGSAVTFAGATVIVALVALVLSGIPVLAQMGLVAAGAVAAAVLLSLTLTPALLSLLGYRVMSRRTWRKVVARGDEDKAQHGFARKYVALVTAKPWLTVLAVLALVGLLAVPAADLRLGLPDGSSDDPGTQGLRSYTAVAKEFGPGMNGPLLVTARLDEPGKDEVLKTQTGLMHDLSAIDGIAHVVPVGVSKDNATMAFQVVPETGPTEERTTEVVHELIDQAEVIGYANDASLGLTGQTVANIEISERLSAALPGYLAVVVGLSLVILMLVFRSVLVPLIATGGFLLSVMAAFGATVAVFQWGWLGSLLGVHAPGPIMSFGPILLIGVLFGLAMDYQMFLVSGMHEAHSHGERPRSAVRIGFVNGALVVTAAAAIMFAVFGGFVFSHMVMMRPIGFGLAVGVLIDAFLVRMTLVPALMHLLGARAWFLPRWLDRLLPDLDVEGRALTEHRGEQAVPKREPALVQ